ncbi:DUF6053 domain-containing protein [Lysobacter enzymogenes]
MGGPSGPMLLCKMAASTTESIGPEVPSTTALRRSASPRHP